VEIAEAKNAIALAFKKSVATGVTPLVRILEMLATVDFHDELRCMRNEVDDIRSDRHLPAKADAVEAVGSDAVPDDPPGVGQIAPQVTCACAGLLRQPPSRRVRCVAHGA